MLKNYSILCVDDNEDNVELLKFFLEREGSAITTCGTAEECLDYIKKKNFDAIVLDYRLSDRDGLEVCTEIKQANPKTPVIFFSGDVRNATRNLAIKAGADAYLVKPDDLEKIVPTIRNLVSSF